MYTGPPSKPKTHHRSPVPVLSSADQLVRSKWRTVGAPAPGLAAPTVHTSRLLVPHTDSRPPSKPSCTICQLGAALAPSLEPQPARAASQASESNRFMCIAVYIQ